MGSIVKGKFKEYYRDGRAIVEADNNLFLVEDFFHGEEGELFITKTGDNNEAVVTKYTTLSKYRDELSQDCKCCSVLKYRKFTSNGQFHMKKAIFERRLMGLFLPAEIHPLHPNKHYLSHGTFNVITNEDNKIGIGHPLKNSNQLVCQVNQCERYNTTIIDVCNKLSKILENLQIFPYNNLYNVGSIYQIEILTSCHYKEAVLTLYSKTPAIPNRLELIKKLKKACPYLTCIIDYTNHKGKLVIHRTDKIRSVKEKFLGLNLLIIYDQPFITNRYVYETIYRILLMEAAIKQGDRVIDINSETMLLGLLAYLKSTNCIATHNDKKQLYYAKNIAILNNIPKENFLFAKPLEALKKGKNAIIFLTIKGELSKELFNLIISISFNKFFIVLDNLDNMLKIGRAIRKTHLALVRCYDKEPWNENMIYTISILGRLMYEPTII